MQRNHKPNGLLCRTTPQGVPFGRSGANDARKARGGDFLELMRANAEWARLPVRPRRRLDDNVKTDLGLRTSTWQLRFNWTRPRTSSGQ